MREIKFRIWDIKRKFMRGEGAFNLREIACNIDDIGEFFSNERECEVMQFTGLRDSKGKEIYEGDIVKRGDGLKVPVEYKIMSSGTAGGVDFLVYGYQYTSLDEVIGNVFENPDLLPAGKESK